jgi:hypothetical protein
MNKAILRLLKLWTLHVMYMLCARAEIFSKKEREGLAQMTADLHEAMDKELEA